LTGTAAAAPIATLNQDVDGDGSDDKIELDAGELRIETPKGASKVAIAGKLDRATVGAAVARGVPTIIVQAEKEGFVVQRVGGTWKLVGKTTIGPVGLDGDYGIALEAIPEGVFRFQTRAGYQRCDGKPAYLFAERFDGSKFVELSSLPTFMPANAPVIPAHTDQAAPQSTLMFKARFASHQAGAPDAGALAIPQELDDGKPTTWWREELAGFGEGHFVTFVPRINGATAKQIRILPAKIKNANRPQRLGVVTAQGAWRIELPDAKDTGFVAELPAGITGCVTIVIESTYGTQGTTAFAELQVWSDNEYGGGGDVMFAGVVASGGEGSEIAAQTLARRGAAGVAAIAAQLGTTKDGMARRRLIRALIDNGDPSKGPILARAVSEGWVGAELTRAIAALEGLGQGQALHDVAAKQSAPIEARVAAVRALQPAVDTERELLIGLAGRGPREVRQAVIEKLTDVPVATLAPVAAAESKASASGDMWRAITRRAHAKAEERGPAMAALGAALPNARDYERRYRIVDGLAAVGDLAALRSITSLFKQWPANEETLAIKVVAARAIAVNPREDAVELIATLANDGDPGVRLAALSALAVASGATTTTGPWSGSAGPDGVDRVIMTRLASDSWPEVRRYAAQVLGGRCERPGPEKALGDAVMRDPDIGVRGDALAALVECKAELATVLLPKLWDDGKAPIGLRQRAVTLTVTLGDKALAQQLVGKYKRWREAAIESEEALRLAQDAAYAIGALAPPGAAEALAASLDDSAFPELVAAAASGLGLLGKQCPAGARARLTQLAQSDEEQVRVAARRAAEVCGK
jgi:hypothetical protein